MTLLKAISEVLQKEGMETEEPREMNARRQRVTGKGGRAVRRGEARPRSRHARLCADYNNAGEEDLIMQENRSLSLDTK